jgi:hypothetical protein
MRRALFLVLPLLGLGLGLSAGSATAGGLQLTGFALCR